MYHAIPPEQLRRELLKEKTDLYNTLYLFGDPEKTIALIARLRTDMTNRKPATMVRHITGTAFREDVITRCHRGDISNIKRDYQGDMLILEGLEYVAGREATEEKLYGILDWYLENGKRIIVTGDGALDQLTRLAPRIHAQLSGGISLLVA